MSAADVRHPVAHGLVNGFLECFLAGLDADDRRAHQPHAKHVQRLPLHVVRAHVDDALEPELRAGRCRRHAVLAGAGLGDDALLAHAPCEQRLGERIVDFVRSRMQQVLALEINLGATAVLRQTLREIKLGRPTGEFLQMVLQFGLELRIVPRLFIRRVEFLQGRHQGLRHKHATAGAKMPGGIGLVEARSLADGGSNGSGHTENHNSGSRERQTGFVSRPSQCPRGVDGSVSATGK